VDIAQGAAAPGWGLRRAVTPPASATPGKKRGEAFAPPFFSFGPFSAIYKRFSNMPEPTLLEIEKERIQKIKKGSEREGLFQQKTFRPEVFLDFPCRKWISFGGLKGYHRPLFPVPGGMPNFLLLNEQKNLRRPVITLKGKK
jgi:hypothetical protein